MTHLHLGVMDYEGFKSLSVAIARGTIPPRPATLWFPTAEALAGTIAPATRILLARLHPGIAWQSLTLDRHPQEV